jgi:large subunit ribosomal protein L20
MPRTKGGVKHAKKKKKVMKAAKGFRGGFGTLYRSAIEFTMRAKKYATRDRAQKKRHFRSLWITRLSAALRERGIAYNRFIPALVAAGIELNRKMLSELAITTRPRSTRSSRPSARTSSRRWRKAPAAA